MSSKLLAKLFVESQLSLICTACPLFLTEDTIDVMVGMEHIVLNTTNTTVTRIFIAEQGMGREGFIDCERKTERLRVKGNKTALPKKGRGVKPGVRKQWRNFSLLS
jgi:hypothetical protein